MCSSFFCSHKYGKIKNNFLFQNFTKLSKIWGYDPGFRRNLFRISDPGVKKMYQICNFGRIKPAWCIRHVNVSLIKISSALSSPWPPPWSLWRRWIPTLPDRLLALCAKNMNFFMLKRCDFSSKNARGQRQSLKLNNKINEELLKLVFIYHVSL